MKTFGIALFIIALAGVSTAQTSPVLHNPPDIEISNVKWNWFHVNTTGGNPLFAADSKANPMTQQAVVGGVTAAQPYYVPTAEDILLDNPVPGKGLTSNRRRFPLVNGYMYEATIRNRGAKTIKAIRWQYVFSDPVDQSILSRHSFYTKAKISPGKKRKLSKLATAPPTKVISAKALANNPKKPFAEQVLITRIEYADGTIWEAPSK